MQTEFEIATDGAGVHAFTDATARWLAGRGDGLLTLFVRHTSCSLLIQENADPAVQDDLLAFLRRLAPAADAPGMGWITHRAEGPDDMPAHIRAALLPVSLTVPVRAGRMALGTWQGLYLVEHRARPQRRRVAAHFAPDTAADAGAAP